MAVDTLRRSEFFDDFVFEGRFFDFVVCLAHLLKFVFRPPSAHNAHPVYFSSPQCPHHLCCRHRLSINFFIHHASLRGMTGASFLASSIVHIFSFFISLPCYFPACLSCSVPLGLMPNGREGSLDSFPSPVVSDGPALQL